MDSLTIGELARCVGVRPSALRYYEQVGLLPAPPRVNGRRRYAVDAARVVALIQLAQRAGFTIAEMRVLLHGFDAVTPPVARWRELACQKVVELDARIQRAEEMKRVLEDMLVCRCARLEDCAVDHAPFLMPR